MRWFLRSSLLCLCLNALSPSIQAAPGEAKAHVHVVYSGQRLGSIAKRYNVSIEALCNANGLEETDRIQPGQKLLVPPRSDKDGSRTRATNPSLVGQSAHGAAAADATGEKQPAPPRAKSDSAKSDSGDKAPGPTERTHKVEAGQRLGSIAKRYGLSIEELCAANGMKRNQTLKAGQVLTLPSSSKEEPPPKAVSSARAGYLELYTYNARWRGQVLDRKGKLSPAAFRAISNLLGATGSKPRLDERLIRLLVQVSDAFGGRPIRVVSGYRTSSFYEDSRHKLSRAVDFSIPGVANATLRDYLRRFSAVGVGYYPNSSFVHLDVRDGAAYWVDYSGPGEAPRRAPRKTLAQDEHDHDEAETGADGEIHENRDQETRPASLIREASDAAPTLPPLL